jgi:tryptophan synthase alpha chain
VPSGSELIESAFSQAHNEGSRVLVGFLTFGDPSTKHTLRLAQSLILGGVDILELGIPFSDPVADGPVIQAADIRALNAGATTKSTFWAVKELRRRVSTERYVPVVLLSYFNPILRLGVDEFLFSASKSGVDGIVVPDLIFPSWLGNNQGDGEDRKVANDSISFYYNAGKNGLATVMMAAPTTPRSRLNMLISKTNGFLYFVSLLGVTGSREAKQSIDQTNLRLIKRTSELAKRKSKKIAVGFGISAPNQVRQVLRWGADGVIVGSFFVDIVSSNQDDIDCACKLLTKSARKLKEATIFRR